MALNADLGASNANSYVTLIEADTYFEDRMHSASWLELDDPTKSNLLVSSSQMLDWYIHWKGVKTTETQSMDWPRTGVIRPSGVEIDSDALPPEVKIAVYEQAMANIASDRLEDDPLAGIGELKAGSLMIKAGASKPNQTNRKPVPPQVFSIVSDLYNQGGVVRLLRA